MKMDERSNERMEGGLIMKKDRRLIDSKHSGQLPCNETTRADENPLNHLGGRMCGRMDGWTERWVDGRTD